MPNLYSYNTLTNLTREELFLWIAIDQTLEQLGGADAAAALAVLSGQPFCQPEENSRVRQRELRWHQ